MKRLTRILAAFLVLAVLPAAAEKNKNAHALYEKGRAAEARSDYEGAYNFYQQAYQLKPTDITYRASAERVRFLASASHVHRGQLLENSGKLQEALTEFEQAASIDPSSFIATQEMNKIRHMMKQEQSPAPPPGEAAASALTKKMQQAGGPVELAPISDTPITLKMSEDSKTVYETIGKLAGVNVLFDPDYTSRRIRVELNGVTLEEALELTALESKTFWRPVTPNTIFVASDTPAKRKELEQSVIKTFYLTNLSQPNELQDLVNILRTLLDTQRLQQFPSQQAIVVRGTPDQIAMAQKLIEDLDKSRPEVIVEVTIMQVSRDKMHNLGILPPTQASVALVDNTSTTTSTSGNNVGTGNGSVTTTTGNTTGSINLNSLAHLNATNFQVTIPPATAFFLFSDSNTKVIQQPQVRALDGQKATLKIGERVPVATGSFQPGIGGVGINPLVNTQFNYIDVGVNIDITPRIHGTDRVTMKIAMDVSNIDSYQNIGGIQQPVIGQRKIEHEISLREGEVNIMGGLFEEDLSKSLQGWPGLAQIPIIHYLFGQSQNEIKNNELVFAIEPHIVRAQDISQSNMREIDVGTANNISLRRGGTPPQDQSQMQGQQPGQPRSSAAPGGTAQQPGAPQPVAAVQPAASVSTDAANAPPGSPIVSFDPAMLNPAVGSTFTVNVNLAGGQNVSSIPVQVMYNPRVLQLLNVSNGTLLSQDGQTVALVHRDDSMAGLVQLTASRPPGTAGISGNGAVFTLTFQAKTAGQATLSVNRAMVRTAAEQNLPASGSQAIVTVH